MLACESHSTGESGFSLLLAQSSWGEGGGFVRKQDLPPSALHCPPMPWSYIFSLQKSVAQPVSLQKRVSGCWPHRLEGAGPGLSRVAREGALLVSKECEVASPGLSDSKALLLASRFGLPTPICKEGPSPVSSGHCSRVSQGTGSPELSTPCLMTSLAASLERTVQMDCQGSP